MAILASILIASGEHERQELPRAVAENIESFKRHHPGLVHHLFRAEETRYFIAEEYGGEVVAAYDALKPFAFRSDLARLCILLKHGGVYADLSVLFLAPWNLVPARLGVFRDFLYAAPWQVANTVIYAPPGHRAIARAIEMICANVRQRYYGASFLCPTGPVAFGKAIAESCQAGDMFTGDSLMLDQIPGQPGLIGPHTHAFVFQGRIVAVKRKRGGASLLELGLKGSNTYRDLWSRRGIYGGGM
ncbi:MAG TPA: glycosyltransferase [Rhizomicrobium sp.]|nr:glycosyltransferase [Rhizomicrobium sp.]